SPVTFSLSSELLAFDLPQNTAGRASLVAGQHAALSIQPGVATSSIAGFALNANSFLAEMDWSPGSAISWQAGVTGLTMTSNVASIGPLSLTFPASSGFDVSNLPATATALGISIPNLELLLRVLIARGALAWGGVPGYTIAALVGLHSDLTGLPPDWPLLAD